MKTKSLMMGTSGVAMGILILMFAIGSYLTAAQAQSGCSVGQYQAKYWDSTGGRFNKCEKAPINYDWKESGPKYNEVNKDCPRCDPAQKTLGPDKFNAEWTGRFHFDAGTYTFIAMADDGIKVWVDGDQIINEWRIQPATRFERKRSMTAGVHQIRVEYFEQAENAVAKFWWEKK